MTKEPLILNNWNMGGISESRILGESDRAMYKMVGTDIHNRVGLLQNGRRLVKSSGATVDGFVKNQVECSNGYIYLFSSTSGKIWSYLPSAGTYSLVYTTASTTGDSNILGACEYDNYLYWATQNYLYRIQLDYTGLTWSSYVEEVGKLNVDPVSGDSGYLGGDSYTTNLYTSLLEDATVTFTMDDNTVTFTNATDKVNLTSHSFLNGDIVVFTSTGVLPAEIVEGQEYYVVNKGTNDFEISETSGGSKIDITDDGTGTHTVFGTGVVNLSSHSFADGDTVMFTTTGSLPSVLSTGVAYYVVNKATNTFELSLTSGGSAINFIDEGSGVQTVKGNGNEAFTPQLKTLSGIAINIDTVPSTSLTITLHDSSDSSIATKTVTAGSLTTGVNEIYLDTEITYVRGESYHLHIFETGTGGKVATAVSGDLDNVYLELYGTSNDTYHPMIVLNGILFIGDGRYIHQVENVLTLNALDIPAQYVARCLGKIGIDLLVGTEVSNNVHSAMIFRWNTWGVSWSIEDDIEEDSINAFIPVDNFVYVVAGTRSNVYFYNGEKLELFRRIGGEFTGTDEVTVHPDAVVNLHGIPLIGVSSVSGTALEAGVYGMGTANPRIFPRVFDLEYVTSQGMSGIEIGSIGVLGNSMLVAWKKTVGETVTYGVDGYDGTNLYSGTYIQTRVLYRDRRTRTVYRKAIVNYFSVPDNTATTVTFDNATDTVDFTSHGYQDGEPIVFSGGTLPAELTEGTVYYVVNKTDDTFQLSATSGGSAIDFTDDGTGTITVAMNNLVRLYYRKDYADSWTELTLLHDTDKKQFITESWGDYAFCLEIKLEIRAKGSESPIIDEITLVDE